MSTLDELLRVLFLDIDGVLNSTRTQVAFDGYPHSFSARDMERFDRVAIALVRRLCRETDCSVVLSSSWRLNPGYGGYTAHQAANALDLPIMDVTPDMGTTGTRAMEIAAWLAAHPEVATYAIVDDILDFDDLHGKRWVLTDPDAGLSMDNYSDLCRLLGKKEAA